MSFWSRFSKKDQQLIEIIQSEFDNLRKKSDSEFIGLVGISGNIKGLDIISSVDDNSSFDVRKIKGLYAKLAEAYLRIMDINFASDPNNSLKYILFEYGAVLKYCIVPIAGNAQFTIVALTKNIQKILNGMDKIIALLIKLEQARNEQKESV